MTSTLTETACRYCPNPAHEDSVLCGFHLDWECACNIVEDECGGSTPGSYVVYKMVEDFGWTPEQINENLGREVA